MRQGPTVAPRQTFLYRQDGTSFCIWACTPDVTFAGGDLRVHIKADGEEIVLVRATPRDPWVRRDPQH